MFSDGEVWLDTSVILPLLAEDLVDDPRERHYGELISAAIRAGVTLHVIPGVLEELDHHIRRSVACHRLEKGRWEGEFPYLYQRYVLSGRDLRSLPNWIEGFRGEARPEEDIAQWLAEGCGIDVVSLEAECKNAPSDLRSATRAIWEEIHDRRRRARRVDIDPIIAQRLVQHDVENFLGVLRKRVDEKLSPFGYRHWWLTFDRAAFGVHEKLKEDLSIKTLSSPVMSPDFLVNYLAFGPRRGSVGRQAELLLPVLAGEAFACELPREVVEIADRVRAESAGLPESIIRRRVRDDLDEARRRIGVIARDGLASLGNALRDGITP
jgi:hypothetical protein